MFVAINYKKEMKKELFIACSLCGTMYGAQNETYIEGWEKKTSNLLIYKRLCNV